MNYSIKLSPYGLYTSFDKDGTPMTTALTEDACRFVTDNIRIPVLQGTWDGETGIRRVWSNTSKPSDQEPP